MKTIIIKAFDSDTGRVREFDFNLPATFDELKKRVLTELDKKDPQAEEEEQQQAEKQEEEQGQSSSRNPFEDTIGPEAGPSSSSRNPSSSSAKKDEKDALIEGRAELYFNATLGDGVFLLQDEDHVQSIFENDLSDGDCIGVVVSLFIEGQRERCVLIKCANKAIQGVEGQTEFLFKFCPARPGTYENLKFACVDGLQLSTVHELESLLEVSDKDGEYSVVDNDRNTCRALLDNNLSSGMPVVYARLIKVPEKPRRREIIVEVMFQGTVESGTFEYFEKRAKDSNNNKANTKDDEAMKVKEDENLLQSLKGACKSLHNLLFDENGNPTMMGATMSLSTIRNQTNRNINNDVVLMRAVTATEQPFEKPIETEDEVREHIIRCRATVPSILRLRMERNPMMSDNNDTNDNNTTTNAKKKSNVPTNYFVGEYLKGGDVEVKVFFDEKKERKHNQKEEANDIEHIENENPHQEDSNNTNTEPDQENAFQNFDDDNNNNNDDDDLNANPSAFMAMLVGKPTMGNGGDDDEEDKKSTTSSVSTAISSHNNNSTENKNNNNNNNDDDRKPSHHQHQSPRSIIANNNNNNEPIIFDTYSVMKSFIMQKYQPTDSALVTLCKFCKFVGKKCSIDLLHPLIQLPTGCVSELGLSFSDSEEDDELLKKEGAFTVEGEDEDDNDEFDGLNRPRALALATKKHLQEEEKLQIKTLLRTRRYLRKFPQYKSQVGFYYSPQRQRQQQHEQEGTSTDDVRTPRDETDNNNNNNNNNDEDIINEDNKLQLLLNGSSSEIVETLRLAFERKVPFVCHVEYLSKSVGELADEFEQEQERLNKEKEEKEEQQQHRNYNNNELPPRPPVVIRNTSTAVISPSILLKRKKSKSRQLSMIGGGSSTANQFFDMMKAKAEEEENGEKTEEEKEAERKQRQEEALKREQELDQKKRRAEIRIFAQEWEDLTGGIDNTTEAAATNICGELAPLLQSWNPPSYIPAVVASSSSNNNNNNNNHPRGVKIVEGVSTSALKDHLEQMDPSCADLFKFLYRLPDMISNDTQFALDLCDAEKVESLLFAWTEKLSTPTLISFMHHCRAAISSFADISPHIQLRQSLARCFRAHCDHTNNDNTNKNNNSSSSLSSNKRRLVNKTFLMQTLIATSIEGGGEFLKIENTEEFDQLMSCYLEEQLPRHCFDEIVSYLTDNDPHALSTLFSIAISQRPVDNAVVSNSSSSHSASDYYSFDYLNEEFLLREIERRKEHGKMMAASMNNNNSSNKNIKADNSNNVVSSSSRASNNNSNTNVVGGNNNNASNNTVTTTASASASASASTTTTSTLLREPPLSVDTHRQQHLRRQIRHSMDSITIGICVDFATSIENEQRMMLSVTDTWMQLAWCVAALVQNPVYKEDDMQCSLSWKWLRRTLAMPSHAEELLLVLKTQGPSYAAHDVVVRAGSISLSRDADPRLLLPVSIVMSSISEWVRYVTELTTIVNKWTWPPVYSGLVPTSSGLEGGSLFASNKDSSNGHGSPFSTFSGTRGAMLLFAGGGGIGSHRTSPGKGLNSSSGGGDPSSTSPFARLKNQQQKKNTDENNNNSQQKIKYRPSSSNPTPTRRLASPSVEQQQGNNNNKNNNLITTENDTTQEDDGGDFHYESRRGSPPRGGIFKVPCPPHRVKNLGIANINNSHQNNYSSSSSTRSTTNPRLQALKRTKEREAFEAASEQRRQQNTITTAVAPSPVAGSHQDHQANNNNNNSTERSISTSDSILQQPPRKYNSQFRHLSGRSDYSLSRRKAALDTEYVATPRAREIIEDHNNSNRTPRNLQEAIEEQKKLISESATRMEKLKKESDALPKTKEEISRSFIQNIFDEVERSSRADFGTSGDAGSERNKKK